MAEGRAEAEAAVEGLSEAEGRAEAEVVAEAVADRVAVSVKAVAVPVREEVEVGLAGPERVLVALAVPARRRLPTLFAAGWARVGV